MKKIFLLTAIITLFFAACNEDEFLMETPKDDIFAENLFVNYDGFMNGIYLMLLQRASILPETIIGNGP